MYYLHVGCGCERVDSYSEAYEKAEELLKDDPNLRVLIRSYDEEGNPITWYKANDYPDSAYKGVKE